jgi:cell division protease FtsH
MEEFDKAKDKIMMGSERKSMVMSEEEKAMTAYHEAGHAIVGRLVPEHDPVYKVSIIPRGRALGVTMYLPEQDRVSHSKQHLESMISSLYGGRLAEDIIYGSDKVTTGASNDIERATEIARKMVTQWGLSEKMGPQLYAEEEGEVFLGRTSAKSSSMSDETARAIDAEIKELLDRNYKRAENILKENLDVLHSMKDALMKYETIDAKQIDDLMARTDVRPPADWEKRDKKKDDNATGGSTSTGDDKGAPNVGEPGDLPH